MTVRKKEESAQQMMHRLFVNILLHWICSTFARITPRCAMWRPGEAAVMEVWLVAVGRNGDLAGESPFTAR
jgi:hypothetical protein